MALAIIDVKPYRHKQMSLDETREEKEKEKITEKKKQQKQKQKQKQKLKNLEEKQNKSEENITVEEEKDTKEKTQAQINSKKRKRKDVFAFGNYRSYYGYRVHFFPNAYFIFHRLLKIDLHDVCYHYLDDIWLNICTIYM